VTTMELVGALRRRGLELLTDGDRLGVRPAGQLRPEERAALIARKAEVLALLRAERQPARTIPDDSWSEDVPSGPCGLCGSPLAEGRDWPLPVAARWLCLDCAVRPVPSLEAVYASLTPAERQQLVDEARAGDILGQLLLKLLPARGVA
jgi:TubC N-terminal docking domain